MKLFFLGIVQGLTEFFPVSSSGHLYILKRFFGLANNLLPFFILLHLATLLAIIIFFRRQIKEVFREKNILIHILIITLISAAIGLVVKKYISHFFDYKYVISFSILINALILLKAKNNSLNRQQKDINLKDSFTLGILQGIAVFPGISRSGITISGLLKRGFQAKEAFNLSFLMAIPLILGAFAVEAKEISSLNISLNTLSFSFAAAFFTGIFALSMIKKALIKVKFHNFGYYCLIIFLLTLFL